MRDMLIDDGWSPALATALAELIASTPGGVAAFDFDDTCIEGDLGDAVFHRAVEGRLLDVAGLPPGLDDTPHGWLAAAEQALAEGGPGRGYGYVLEVFAGWSLTRFRAHVDAVLDAELAAPRGVRPLGGDGGPEVRSGIRWRRRTTRLLRRLTDAGWTVHVVSGSARWVVEQAMGRRGVPAGRIHGQQVRLDGERLSSVAVEPPVFGPGKVAVLSAVLDAPPDLAIGDSPNDRELLGWSRHAVALDAGDANSLGPLGRRRGWWVEPVRGGWRPALFEAASIDDPGAME